MYKVAIYITFDTTMINKKRTNEKKKHKPFRQLKKMMPQISY